MNSVIELKGVVSADVSVVISSEGETENSVVIAVSLEDASVAVVDQGSHDDENTSEDVTDIVESIVDRSVAIVSVTVLDDGSLDEIEVRSEESVKTGVSVEISVVKSVELVEDSDEEAVSVVESETSVEIESVIVLDEEASEVEMSVDKMSVDVVKEGSEDE